MLAEGIIVILVSVVSACILSLVTTLLVPLLLIEASFLVLISVKLFEFIKLRLLEVVFLLVHVVLGPSFVERIILIVLIIHSKRRLIITEFVFRAIISSLSLIIHHITRVIH